MTGIQFCNYKQLPNETEKYRLYLVRPRAQPSIGVPITEAKVGNMYRGPLQRKHNAQMIFCKIVNWRIPALGLLSLPSFLPLAQTQVFRFHFLLLCVRLYVHQGLYGLAGQFHRVPWNWLWLFRNASHLSYMSSTLNIRVIWQQSFIYKQSLTFP